MGLTVVEFYQLRHCHWCVHHRWLQPASRGCSLLSFARTAILGELYLPPCCSCTPISVRHPQLPSVTPGPWGGHGPFPLDWGGGALRAYPYWFCMHWLPSGFTPLFFTHASWQTRNLARASRETPSPPKLL